MDQGRGDRELAGVGRDGAGAGSAHRPGGAGLAGVLDDGLAAAPAPAPASGRALEKLDGQAHGARVGGAHGLRRQWGRRRCPASRRLSRMRSPMGWGGLRCSITVIGCVAARAPRASREAASAPPRAQRGGMFWRGAEGQIGVFLNSPRAQRGGEFSIPDTGVRGFALFGVCARPCGARVRQCRRAVR